MLYTKFNNFINEYNGVSPIVIIAKDIQNLNLTSTQIILNVKNTLMDLYLEDREKYNTIMDIFKTQNEVDELKNKRKSSKYTNLMYLIKKPIYSLKIIEAEWSKIKRSI